MLAATPGSSGTMHCPQPSRGAPPVPHCRSHPSGPSCERQDGVYPCWLGEHCGGAAGAPLEKAFGQQEPVDVDWYPEMRDGGIPTDDLEIELIWLKAVEEQGFAVAARELAKYWLDYIGY